MYNLADNCNQDIWTKLTSLKNSVETERKTALKKRISHQPLLTDLEYLLGAYMQMFEPHLEDMVYKLSQKGYAIDPASGFGGKNAQFQVICGAFSLDFVLKNKLERLGIKFREYNGFNSLIFWPMEANTDHIIKRWEEIIKNLPDHGQLDEPFMSEKAMKFRRKYMPKHANLQRLRLFEKLRYGIYKKNGNDIKRRKAKNPHPNKLESSLGLFVEELEPQVRGVITTLYKKGYSTDKSGFMVNPCDQMIEGDFQLNKETITKLQKFDVLVETNPSGYTKLQFTSGKANLPDIKKKWDKIASILPDRKTGPSASMTRKARNFRIKYE